MKLCRWILLLFVVPVALFVAGCASAPPGAIDLTKRGVVIVSPYTAQIVKSGEVLMDIRVSRKIRRKGHHLHIYLDGEMYDMVPLGDPVSLTGLSDGSHRVEIVLTGHKGHSHMETSYKDSVVFITEDSKVVQEEHNGLPESLPEGLGYNTPDEVFRALFSVVVKPDDSIYRKILGRSYKDAKVRYRSESEKRKKVVAISEINITKTGREVLGRVNLYFIFSTQLWKYSDGSVKKQELDLHFREIGGRWIYFPMKGTPLL